MFCRACRPKRDAALGAYHAATHEAEPDDDPDAVIDAKLAAAERAVRGTIPLEPWAMTTPRIAHEDTSYEDLHKSAKRVKGPSRWSAYYPVRRAQR